MPSDRLKVWGDIDRDYENSDHLITMVGQWCSVNWDLVVQSNVLPVMELLAQREDFDISKVPHKIAVLLNSLWEKNWISDAWNELISKIKTAAFSAVWLEKALGI